MVTNYSLDMSNFNYTCSPNNDPRALVRNVINFPNFVDDEKICDALYTIEFSLLPNCSSSAPDGYFITGVIIIYLMLELRSNVS